jgi:alpha-glucosidase
MSAAANPANVVTAGRVRFTFLSDRMLRLEWAEDGLFEDLATLTVTNRDTEPVAFSRADKGRSLVLRTRFLTITHVQDDQKLSRKNLSIQLKVDRKSCTWWPGKPDKLNLKGTTKTLDGINGGTVRTWIPLAEKDDKKPVLLTSKDGARIWQGDHHDLPLCDGLISRSGWAVVDDSTSVVLDPALCEWQPWVRERHPGKRQDLYFLGYGLDFKAALRDASRVFGRQPLPPRYALGYWYSRYWAYTDKELQQLVDDFDTMNLPLDVLVIDMDWHKLGWTGYSWDPDFFPDPAGLLARLRKRGIKITLNLHPADGVFDFEDAYPAMLKAMGLRAEDVPDLEPLYHRLYELLGLDTAHAKRIPLNICDPNYMRAYFSCLHHPLEKMGVDFWWMDWQQGTQGSQLPHLDTLPWINELHWQDQVRHRPTQRPINFSRFGGIGAGRMPVGFSGDTIVTWESLAFQPYFTSTASNVLYGYWSHDIGGHMGGQLTPELYARWIQFGVYSPVLRTHTSKSLECERRVFHFPDPARASMAASLRRRYELVPYIYGAMRAAYDSGVSLVRPMYYDFPGEKEAYRVPQQFMFGDDMLLAPVVSPLDPETEMASVSVWLPAGEWIDCATGERLEGGKTHKRLYTLEETPVFVRPGTVIPEQTFTTRLKPGAYPGLVFRIFPGKTGEGCLYEDDGSSTAWQQGEQAQIRISHSVKAGVRSVTLHPATGTYSGFKAKRPVTLLFEGFAPPTSISAGTGAYDGDTACLRVDLGTVDLTNGLTLEIQEAPAADQAAAAGLKGKMTRLEKVRAYNCQVSPAHPVHGEERLAVKAAQTGNRIKLHPERFREETRQLETLLERLPTVLREYAALYHKADAETPDAREQTLLRAARLLRATPGKKRP